MDKVTAPNFPAITNLRQWHNQLARNLVLASGRTDGAEVKWLCSPRRCWSRVGRALVVELHASFLVTCL